MEASKSGISPDLKCNFEFCHNDVECGDDIVDNNNGRSPSPKAVALRGKLLSVQESKASGMPRCDGRADHLLAQ